MLASLAYELAIIIFANSDLEALVNLRQVHVVLRVQVETYVRDMIAAISAGDETSKLTIAKLKCFFAGRYDGILGWLDLSRAVFLFNEIIKVKCIDDSGELHYGRGAVPVWEQWIAIDWIQRKPNPLIEFILNDNVTKFDSERYPKLNCVTKLDLSHNNMTVSDVSAFFDQLKDRCIGLNLKSLILSHNKIKFFESFENSNYYIKHLTGAVVIK
ncbi:Hypothetical protein MVR_LOCUS348 [uncultured virus]|nr:Hypothetical protein MVR_LOCUS348 [uncultured virus]